MWITGTLDELNPSLHTSIGVSIERKLGTRLGPFGQLSGTSKAANPMD